MSSLDNKVCRRGRDNYNSEQSRQVVVKGIENEDESVDESRPGEEERHRVSGINNQVSLSSPLFVQIPRSRVGPENELCAGNSTKSLNRPP